MKRKSLNNFAKKHNFTTSNILKAVTLTHKYFRHSLIASLMSGILALCHLAAKADNDSIRYEAETVATFSGGEYTPFWLMNNLQGLGSPTKNNGYVRAGVFKDIDRDKRFSWGAGVDLAAGWNMTAPFSVHQLYGEIKISLSRSDTRQQRDMGGIQRPSPLIRQPPLFRQRHAHSAA